MIPNCKSPIWPKANEMEQLSIDIYIIILYRYVNAFTNNLRINFWFCHIGGWLSNGVFALCFALLSFGKLVARSRCPIC